MRTRILGVVLLGALAGMSGACGDDGGGGSADAGPVDGMTTPDAAPVLDGGRDGAVADADPNAPDADLPDADPDLPDADLPDAEEADADPDLPDADLPDAAVPFGERHHMVASQLKVPHNSTESTSFGIDLDGDPNHRPDNAMGGIFAALAQQNIDVRAATDAAVAAGQVISLHVLQTSSLTSAPLAFWSVFTGAAHPAPDYSGAGSFALAAGAPVDSLLVGHITGGTFVGGPGKARFQMLLAGAPIALDLVGARVEAQVSATGCTGKVGGAVTQADVQTKVIPQLAMAFTNVLHGDPGCPGACTGTALTLQNLFDTNHDGTITAAEVSASTLVQALLAPDVDLFDASGHFNPRQDHVNDSLSIGFGLTCVGASFQTPGE
jgi:hypothetical protein